MRQTVVVAIDASHLRELLDADPNTGEVVTMLERDLSDSDSPRRHLVRLVWDDGTIPFFAGS